MDRLTEAMGMWIILFEGMLRRVYRFQDMVNRMLSHTAGRNAREFVILSAHSRGRVST